MRIRLLALVTAGIMVALMVATAVIVHLGPIQRGVADRLTTIIEAKTCLSAEVDFFEYRIWPATLKVRGISVSGPSGRSLTIEAVDASWAWSQLIGDTPRLRRLEIVGLDVNALELPMPCPADDDAGPSADPWRALEIDDLTITRAGVSGESPDLKFTWTGLAAQAALVDQRLGLRATARNLHLRRDGRDLTIGPLTVEIQGSPKTIELKTLRITGGPLEFEAEGSAAGDGAGATAQVSANVALDEILRWWDPSVAALVDPRGRLDAVADLSWDTNAGLRFEARLAGQPVRLAGYTISRFEAAYEEGRLTAEAADPSWGRVDMDLGPDEIFEVRARLKGADPTPALKLAAVELPAGIPEDVGLSGDLQARMTLPPEIDRMTGSADLEARWKGSWARLRGKADNGIVIDQASGHILGADLEASGTITNEGSLGLQAAVHIGAPGDMIARLSPFLPELETLIVEGGPLDADLRLGGTLATPSIDTDIRWEAPEIEGNRLLAAHARVQGTLDDANWAATLDAEGGRVEAEGTASIRSGKAAGDWRLEAADLSALRKSIAAAAGPAVAGSITGRGTLRFEPNGWGATAQIDARDISAGPIAIPHLMFEAQVDPDCASIDSIKVDILEGHIEGAGTLCPIGVDGEIQAAIRWSDLDPNHLVDTIPDPARGLTSGRLNLKGPLSDPTGSALLSWESRADDAPLESAILQAHLEHGLVTVVSDRLESISGPLILRADLPMGGFPKPICLFPDAPSGPWQISLAGHDLALGPLVAILEGSDLNPTGSCDLDLRVSWPPDQGGLPQVHLEIPDFEITIAGRTIAAKAPIRAALDDRGVVVADIDLQDDLSRLVAGGSYNLMTSEIDLSIDGSLDPALASLAPVPVTFRGPLTIKGRIQGPADAWVGYLNLDHEDGAIEMRDPPLEITDASLEAQWQDGILEITGGSAQVNRGSIALGGAWDPESGQGIIAEMEDVTALLPGGIVTRWDGVIAFEPASDRLMTVAGDLSLKYGVWDYPFDLGAAVRGADDEAVPGADDITHRIGLDVEVRGGGGITVDNNLGQFGVRWNVLEIGGTVAQPRIMGDLNLLPGGVLMAAGQPIKIRRGLVQFTGDPLTDPLLEVVPEDLGSTTSWDLDASGDAMQQQASSMAAAGLASGLGAVFGLENTTIRPEEIAMETDEDTSTDFSIGQQLNHNTALFLTTDLRDSQTRTTLLQLWRLPSFPGLTLQAMTRTDPGEADFKLLQRFSWGGTQATDDQPRLHKVQLEGEWPWSKRKLRKATGLVRDQPWDPFFLFLGDIRLEKKLMEENKFVGARPGDDVGRKGRVPIARLSVCVAGFYTCKNA